MKNKFDQNYQALKKSVHKVKKKLDGSLNVLLDTDTVESISLIL